MRKIKLCVVKGCNGKHHAKGYCNKHYRQYKRHGKILRKTIYDPTQIILNKDYAEIIIINKNCQEKLRTKIDLDDVDKVKCYKWNDNNNGYIKSIIHGKGIYLHRLITDCPEGLEVDHINHDKLDNRKANLRIVTPVQNSRNRKSKGYCLDKRGGKWMAYIRTKEKFINLGYFIKKEDAINARKKAEIKYFKEYRYKDENNK